MSSPAFTNPSRLIFTATTSSKPAEVKWAIDNVEAGTATGLAA